MINKIDNIDNIDKCVNKLLSDIIPDDIITIKNKNIDNFFKQLYNDMKRDKKDIMELL